MKRVLLLIFVVFSLCLLCIGCSNEKNDTNFTTSISETTVEIPSTTQITTEKQSEVSTENHTEIPTEKQTNSQSDKSDITTTTKKGQSNSTLSDEDMEKIKNTNAKVYFSDSPDNPHIVAVSKKYGAKKENLVALIKVNADFPSATIFEFSGKKDENGELIMTYDEFKYMYEINEEDNTILKISKNCTDNDGVSYIEAKMFVTIAKTYLIPELPKLRESNKYPE